MKKYLMMFVELVLLLGAFALVAFVHNDVIVPKSGAYATFLYKNLPIMICIMFFITSVLVVIIFQIKKLILKDRYESIIKMSNFSRLRKQDILLLTVLGVFIAMLFLTIIKVSFIESSFPGLDGYIAMFMNSETFFMVIVGMCIVGPLFEEIFFRGILFNIMRKGMPFVVALLLQAVLYGYFQPNPAISVFAFFLAIIYGIMYYRLKSIWSTIWTAAVISTIIFVTRKFGFHEMLANMPDHILFLIAGISLFFVVLLLVSIWKGTSKTTDLKMIGNLFFWTIVYAAVYYPFIFILWNNGVMSIDAIRPWLGDNNVLGFVPYDIVAFIVYFYLMKIVHKKNLIKVSNFSQISAKNAVVIAVLGLAAGVWVQLFFKIPFFAEKFPQFDQLTIYLTTAIIPVYILFLIVHSTYKEIFFRAMIYNVLRSALPIWISIPMTGIIYGGLFFNWDIALTVYASLGALIFSLMFEWYKSIWAPIINEFFVFAAYYVLRRMNITFGTAMVWTLVGITLLIIVLMVYLWKNRESAPKYLPVSEKAKIAV